MTNHPSSFSPLLSIVIPLYNEEERIPLLKKDLFQFGHQWEKRKDRNWEAILVNDASQDRTAEMIDDLKEEVEKEFSQVQISCLHLPTNHQKGGSLVKGVSRAQGEYILTMDADVATSSLEIFNWEDRYGLNFSEKETIWVASREHPQSQVNDLSNRRFVGRVFNFLIQLFFSLYMEDTQCGFKLYPGEVARVLFGELKDHGWAHDVELLVSARDRGVEIVSLPVEWTAIEGSKVRVIRDGLNMFASLFFIKIFHGYSRLLRIFTQKEWKSLVPLFFFLLYLGTILTHYQDYGITRDEAFHYSYGQDLLNYFSTGGKETVSPTHSPLYFRGGAFDMLCAFVSNWLPGDGYAGRRLLTGLVSFLILLYTYYLTFFLVPSRRFALLASILVALTPRFFGSSLNNPGDISAAFFYLLALYYLCQALSFFKENIPKGLLFKLTLAGGLLMATRVEGVIVFVYMGLFWLAIQFGENSRSLFGLSRLLKGARNLLLPLAGAWAIMVLFWPWAQGNPFLRPWWVLTNLPDLLSPGPLLFAGTLTPPDKLASYYLFQWLAVALPPLLTLTAPIYLLACLAGWNSFRRRVPILLLIASFFPLLATLALSQPLSPGISYFLFLIPLLAAMTSYLFFHLYNWAVKKLSPSLSVAALTVVLLLSLGPLVHWNSTSHPYQYLYFNAFAGGVKKAAGRYELDYRGNGFYLACEQVKKEVEGQKKTSEKAVLVAFERRKKRDAIWHGALMDRYLSSSPFQLAKKEEDWDYFICTANRLYWKEKPSENQRVKKYGEITCQGVPVVVIYQRKD